MIQILISCGKYIYYISCIAYENRIYLLTMYSLFDTSKFIFYATDKIGIIELIRKKITYIPVIIIVGNKIEKSKVGDFEIIEI